MRASNTSACATPCAVFALAALLLPLSPSGSLTPLSALPMPVNRQVIERALERGGDDRRRAIWMIYQMEMHDLLRDGVALLLVSDDEEDHRAILHLMQSYGDDLERYLPDWWRIFERYMDHTRPADVLVSAIAISERWSERRLMGTLGRLATHPRREVRLASYRAMASMGDDNIIPILLRLANDPRPIHRLYALEGFFHHNDPRTQRFLLSQLDHENKSVRIYAITSYSRHASDEDANRIVRMLSSEERDDVRERIIEVIAARNWGRHRTVVRRHVADPSPLVRRAATLACVELSDRPCAQSISEQLRHEPSFELRFLALESLMRLGDGGGGAGIAERLRRDENPLLRQRAALAAAVTREKGALDGLLDIVRRDPELAVRVEAAQALGRIGDERAIEPLLLLVRSPEQPLALRQMSLQAIVELRGEPTRALSLIEELRRQVDDGPMKAQLAAVANELRRRGRER